MEEIIRNKVCFVCGDDNPHGLRIRFFTNGQEAVADYTPPGRYQGYEGILHGGLISTLLDEIMAKAVLAMERQGMTVEMHVRFKKAVPLNQPLRLVGRVTGIQGRLTETAGEITSANGAVYATATGKFLEVPSMTRLER